MAREIKVDMSRESVDLEDLSSRLAHKKVCNINLKRNQNTLLKGLEVINELVKSGRLHAEGEYEIIRTPERLKEVSDQFEPYKHHGSVHKSQIKLKTEETTISATGTKVTVYLEYKDLEQYKEAFLRFAKPFSDTDIEKCWEQVLADDTRVIEFDGFSTETSKFNGNIEYMSIYGSIE